MARTGDPRGRASQRIFPQSALLPFILAMIVSLAPALAAQTSVTTSQYSNARNGANAHEKILTPASVSSGHFGKLHSAHVDGDVYAQPLYLPQVDVQGKGKRNLLFVATEHDSVYAFDADGDFSAPLWQVSFLKATSGVTTIRAGESGCPLIRPEIGITSTPVIDAASHTIYVLARTEENGRPAQRLHALDVATGAEKSGSPVEIGAPGFDALLENPRAALLLVDSTLYLGWASNCDYGAYHGWLMAYDANTLKQLGALNTSPNATQSGIWAADAGFAADERGNIFVATGNGTFDLHKGGSDYGDSLLKIGLDSGALSIRDYFTPSNQDNLSASDSDLGSGGPVLLPDQRGSHAHLVVIGGKGSVLYLLDRESLGKFHEDSDPSVIQRLPQNGALMGAPAFWENHLYVQADQSALKDFVFKDGKFGAQPASRTPERFTAAGTPEVSSDGARNGIVWTLETRAFGFSVGEQPAILYAYDASNLARELYSSGANAARDAAGPSLRFSIPTIVDGSVYVGTIKEVDVYGLLPAESAAKK